jgi:nucleoside-diphosphate-sugar epimerase
VNILIIGGTGLISTPMTRQLAERGHAVTVFNRGKRSPHLPEGVGQILGDRNDHAAFESLMREQAPFDCVIDMICYKPEDAQSLVRAFRGNVGHLIVCSTVDVYEKPQGRFPITEDTTQRPAPYDYPQDKVKCEVILSEANARGDFPLTIFRPGHTYHDGGALHHSLGSRTTYLDRLRKGQPIVVHGDGSSFWAACHAIDVARAFTESAGNPVAFGKAYNVAGEWMTWNQYHLAVAEALGAPAPTFVHIPTDLLVRLTDRARIVALNFQYNNLLDNTAAQRDLNFHQTIPFLEGARRIYQTLEKQGRIEDSDTDPLDDRIIAAWERWSAKMVEEVKAAPETPP